MFGGSAENLNCCFYIRVSTTKQAETGYGEDLQETDCRAMAQIKKWNIVKIYKDSGISGTLDEKDRPALKELLQDARDKKFDMVIIYAIDRLGRDTLIINDIIRQLSKSGVGIVSTKESLDSSTPQGKFVINLFAGLAEMDRSNIVERMKKGKEELRKKKGWTGGILPYGYKMVEKEITIHEKEAHILRFIFEKHELGMRPGEIAKTMNSLNIPSRRGVNWSRDSVKKIISREDVYQGGIIKDNLNNIRWPKII